MCYWTRDFSKFCRLFVLMFFWPLNPEVDVPLTPEGHPPPPLDLASVWKSSFRCFYEKCFFDLWPRKLMFLWPRKDTLVHHWTLLRCENRDFDVFMRNVFLTFDPGSWCSFDPGRTPSSTIGPCFGVKIEISMFLWEMFFWPLTFDLAQTNKQTNKRV